MTPARRGDETGAPDKEFLDGTGRFAEVETGLNNVDFWIGGLAENALPSGGLLGSTFNFVFETQMENLQNGDRFYYLSRLEGTNFLTQLEGTSFSELVMRNSSATHLPFDVFSVPTHTIEVSDPPPFRPTRTEARWSARQRPGMVQFRRSRCRSSSAAPANRTTSWPAAVLTPSGAMAATIASMAAPATTR